MVGILRSMERMARISVLGEPGIVTDDDVSVVSNVRQSRLLLALVFARDALTHDQLAERLWEDDERPDEPTASIRSYANRLRSRLGDDQGEILITRPGGYAVDRRRISIDQVEFENLVFEESETLDPAHRAEVLERALGLWRGNAFGSLAELAWVTPEAVRLEELRVAAEENLLRAKLDLGKNAEVVARAEQLLKEHPYREGLREVLIVGLYRADRQVDALRAFEEHRTRLVEDLGVDASPTLRRLEHLVLTQDASLDAVGGMGRPLRGYRLRELIGSGAVSLVYRGLQPSVGRETAIKVIRSELANRPKFAARFQAEAQTIARLEHPHIVPLYDYWREPDRAYLVMRLLPSNLDDAIADGSISSARLSDIVVQVAGALDFAHESGVVHRDVKPANILLDREGNAFLSDFGIAVDELVAAEREAGISSSSEEYRAPEYHRVPATPAADIYALGLVSRAALERADGDLSDTVEAVIGKATAADPEIRHKSALAFATELREAVTGITMTELPPVGENPYRGLQSFEEADAAVFFGRERTVGEIIERLERESDPVLVMVVGPSGAGKSSVVKAGLLPAARTGALGDPLRWLVASMRPGSDPFEALASALEAVATGSGFDIESAVRSSSDGLTEVLSAIVPEGGHMLLLVDQLEELYTVCLDESVRDGFLDLLAYSLENASHLRVVAALRADMFERPLENEAFAKHFSSSVLTVAPMDGSELEAAIVGPARAARVNIEDGLVGQLVSDVLERPGALPLLQFTLTELFDRRDSDSLALADYQSLGGLGGALLERAEGLYEELYDARRRGLIEMLARLVDVSEVPISRRPALRADLIQMSAVDDELIDRMGAMRLLSFDHAPESREPIVEISHEALLTEWPRLSDWIAERRSLLLDGRRLESARREWDRSGRKDSFLLAGDRLAVFRHLRESGVIGAADAEFLDLSEEAEAAGVRAKRRRRSFVAGSIGAVLVIAVVLGVLALAGQREAEEERDASAQTLLINRALYEADRQSDLALLLAVEAYRRDPGPNSSAALLDILSVQTIGTTVNVEAEHEGPAKEASCWSSTPRPGVFVSVGGGLFGPAGEVVVFDALEGSVELRMDAAISCGAEMLADGRLLGTMPGNPLPRPVIVDRNGDVTDLAPDVRRGFSQLHDGRLLGELFPLGDPNGTGQLVEIDPGTGVVVEETGIATLELVVDPNGRFAVTQEIQPPPDGGPDAIVLRGILDLETYQVSPMQETVDGLYFWSPDGSEIYALADHVLARYAPSGEPLGTQFLPHEGRLLNTNGEDIDVDASHLENVTPAFLPSFSPDGSVIAFTTDIGIERFSFPEFAPLGEPIAFDDPVAVSMMDNTTIAVQDLSGVVTVIDVEGSPPLEAWTRFEGAQFLDSPRVGSTFDRVLVDLESGDEVDPYNEFGLGGDVFTAPASADRWLVFSAEGVAVLDSSGDEIMAPVAFSENAREEVAYFRTGDWARLLDATEYEEGQPPTKVIVDSINLADGTFVRSSEIEVEGWLRPPLAGEGGFWAPVEGNRFEVFDWSGDRVATLDGSLDYGSAISPDGSLFALVGEQRTVTVFDLSTAEPAAELLAASHYEAPLFVGGDQLVIRAEDGRVTLWDIPTGVEVGTVSIAPDFPPIRLDDATGGYDPISAGDGKSIWYTQEGRFVKVSLDPEVWIAEACTAAGRSLDPAEWKGLVPFDEPYRDACSS